MNTVTLNFKNHIRKDGTIENFTIEGCLVGQYSSPTSTERQIRIHLPKTTDREVLHSWVEYQGENWYVFSESVKQIESNIPTRWDRYAIAKSITNW